MGLVISKKINIYPIALSRAPYGSYCSAKVIEITSIFVDR